MSQEVDEKIIERIQKLLNLAANNPNEAEAVSAAAKAQELLAEHNLTTATIEKVADAKAGKREQLMVDGGTYEYQRELWKAVAKLNFCFHWVQEYRVFVKNKRVGTGRDRWTTEGHVSKKRHVLVGRIINVAATKAMAGYLQEAIERVTLERLGHREGVVLSGQTLPANINAVRFSNWAVSFRKGCARRVVEQLEDRRTAMLAADAKKKRADEARAKRAGVSTATTLTVADLATQEHAANYDFMYGEGKWAALQENRRIAAKQQRQEEEAYTRWAKAHPEEAAAKEAKKRKERRRSFGAGCRDSTDSGAFWSGYDDAAAISLEQQVDKRSKVAGYLK